MTFLSKCGADNFIFQQTERFFTDQVDSFIIIIIIIIIRLYFIFSATSVAKTHTCNFTESTD